MMVGWVVKFVVDKDEVKLIGFCLDIKDFIVVDDCGLVVVDGVLLFVVGGEIFGVVGVQGNGQMEFVFFLFGFIKLMLGMICIDGKDIMGVVFVKVIEVGFGFVFEDCQWDGFVGEFFIVENFVLNQVGVYFKYGNFQFRWIVDNVCDCVEEFDICILLVLLLVFLLLGGNQQKVVLVCEFLCLLSVLVVFQFICGVDVGVIEFLYKWVVEECDNGIVVFIVFIEFDEIEVLLDCIVVMYCGCIVGIVLVGIFCDVFGFMMVGFSYDEVCDSVVKGYKEVLE